MKNLKITTDITYDWELAQLYFDEAFTRVKGDKFIYTADDQLSDITDLETAFDIETTKANRIKLLKFLIDDCGYTYSEIKKEENQTLWEYATYYIADLSEAQKTLEDLQIEYTENYGIVKVHGYSQGDYGEIYVNIPEFKRVFGNDFDADSERAYFEHLFFDAPLYGTVSVSFDYYHNAVSYHFSKEWDVWEVSDSYDVDINSYYVLKNIESDLLFPLNDTDKDTIRKALDDLGYDEIKYNRCA